MQPVTGTLFSEEELNRIRSCFYYVDEDFRGTHRLFFDNAGGSLRLKAAEDAFSRIDRIPDCSEHSNEIALFLDAIEQQGRKDLMECVFNAHSGVLFPGYSASQIMMDICRVFAANAKGTNVVTTTLEHPSSYDGMKYYADVYKREFRVAKVNKESGGVDADTIIGLIDENTAILSCMNASNISGYIYDIEKICRRAREINPDIFIICDAVQHAPHAYLNPEKYGIDAMNFAPYKFFGIRGFSVAWLSDRTASFMHHRLLEKPADEWGVGSPAPAHYAAISEIVNYVIRLGQAGTEDETNAAVPASSDREVSDLCSSSVKTDRRKLFEAGMARIAEHERALLGIVLEGTQTIGGLRHMKGLKVQMDGADLSSRDFIIGVEFERLTCEQAVAEYEKRGVITFERSASSIYSRRMVEAFDSKGVVRISPLHVNSPAEMEEFLQITREIAALS